MKKLVIFGVGLIGGSVALALKKANFVAHIVGVGRNQVSLNEALKLGVIDAAETNIQAACSDADIILIAAPVAQTKAILQSLQPHLQPQTVVTDAGSTKTDVLAVAEEILAEKASQFIGGHPIAGAEKSGVAAAKADLFMSKNVVLTPHINNDALQPQGLSPQNIPAEAGYSYVKANIHAASRASHFSRIKSMWQACGANVREMSATEHDAIFAAVSHLPHLLAFALVDEIASRKNAEQLFSYAASGFRDFTRIAGSSPEMWRDISLANKTALLHEITAFETELSQLKQLLKKEDGTGLQALFERASVARNNWAEAKK